MLKYNTLNQDNNETNNPYCLTNKLKELYKDLRWEFPALNPNVAKFFAF